MNGIDKAYKHVIAFLLQPHFRDPYMDKHVGITLYSKPLSLFMFSFNGYFKTSISLNRAEVWVEEGYKYEDDK